MTVRVRVGMMVRVRVGMMVKVKVRMRVGMGNEDVSGDDGEGGDGE
jgi:hypothetical protein